MKNNVCRLTYVQPTAIVMSPCHMKCPGFLVLIFIYTVFHTPCGVCFCYPVLDKNQNCVLNQASQRSGMAALAGNHTSVLSCELSVDDMSPGKCV